MYERHLINKLQNRAISLIFKIGKIRFAGRFHPQIFPLNGSSRGMNVNVLKLSSDCCLRSVFSQCLVMLVMWCTVAGQCGGW